MLKSMAGSASLLQPSGRLDHGSGASFEAELLQAVRGGGVVVLDMSEVPYVSSIGLRALMIGAKEAKASQGVLAVAQLQPIVQEIFQISRFHFVMPIFDSVRDALAKLAPDALTQFDQS